MERRGERRGGGRGRGSRAESRAGAWPPPPLPPCARVTVYGRDVWQLCGAGPWSVATPAPPPTSCSWMEIVGGEPDWEPALWESRRAASVVERVMGAPLGRQRVESGRVGHSDSGSDLMVAASTTPHICNSRVSLAESRCTAVGWNITQGRTSVIASLLYICTVLQ